MNFSFQRNFASVLACSLALAVSACGSSDPASSDSASTGSGAKTSTISVYATTGYLADVVKNVAPNAKVTTMVGPGGDPHTFQPSSKDIQTIKKADLVVWNGLHLEARMLDTLKGLGDKQVNIGSKIPKELLLEWPEKGDDGQVLHDPHIWNSPEAWTKAVNEVTNALVAKDSKNSGAYQENAKNYVAAIEKTTAEAKKKLDAVPKDRRILISGHDAFNYFGKTFGFEVHATDFVSSEAKLSPKQLSDLADLIAKNKVPVIFLDNQANPQAIKSLQEAVKARGWDVKIADKELYADSLGSEPDVDTYLEVLTHNANAVSEALGKSA